MGISISGGSITINGKTYTGKNISVVNNQVFIDGVLQDSDISGDGTKRVTLVVTGDIGSLEVKGGSVEVKGTIRGDVNCDGSVSADAIEGSVRAGGSVSCDDVGGDVEAGGSVNCDDVGGNVRAGGSVRYG